MSINTSKYFLGLLLFTYSILSSAAPAVLVEETAEYKFANGNKVKFYLERNKVEFIGRDSNDKTVMTTLLSDLRINRVVDNAKVDQEVGNERVVPTLIDRENIEKGTKFTVVEYLPGEKLDLTVFEAGHQFFMVNSKGGLQKLEVQASSDIDLQKNVAKMTDGSNEVIATKWLFKGLNKDVPSLGALVVYIEGSKELFVLAVGSNGKTAPIPNITQGQKLSYEERYGKVFVEQGSIQVADFDVSHLADNRVRQGVPPGNELLSPTDMKNLSSLAQALSTTEKKDSEQDAEAFVKKHFGFYTDKLDKRKDILPTDAFDVEEINDLRRKMAMPESGGAIIVGESGSGKTALLNRFIKNAYDGAYPELTTAVKYLELDAVSFAATDGTVGRIETKIKKLIEYAETTPTIVVIENIHLMRGSGTHSGNNIDALQMLAPRIADGTVRVIATTNEDYYKKYFAGDEYVGRSLGKVAKKELEESLINEALDRWAEKAGVEKLSGKHLNLIKALSKKHDPGITEMNRALALLKEVYAEMKILDLKADKLTEETIKKVAARKYGVDQRYFDNNQRLSILAGVEKGLEEKISGQKDLKEALKNDARALLTSSGSGKKPLGRRLFFGDRGLGKTYIPEVYADLMGLPFERIKLDENTTAETIKTRIAQAIRKNSMTVFLIDEVEKTRIGVQNELLDVLDSPTLLAEESLDAHLGGKKTAKYVKYNIANATFFLATNAGAQTIKASDSYDAVERKLMDDNLSRYVLDRVADLHHFTGPQERDEFLHVLQIKLAEYIKIKEKEKAVKISVKNSVEMLNELTNTYFRPGASYRGAIDDLENAFKVALSKLEIQNAAQDKCVILLERIKSFRNSRPAAPTKPKMGF